MDHEITTIVGEKETPYGYEIRDGRGGGVTPSIDNVLISSKLEKYGDTGTKSTAKVYTINGQQHGWTAGGVAIHEWLYHVLGIVDKTDEGIENPNAMREYFNIRTGNQHDNGVISYEIPIKEQKKLDEKKEKTGTDN
jgi:hypothetical protein